MLLYGALITTHSDSVALYRSDSSAASQARISASSCRPAPPSVRHAHATSAVHCQCVSTTDVNVWRLPLTCVSLSGSKVAAAFAPTQGRQEHLHFDGKLGGQSALDAAEEQAGTVVHKNKDLRH